MNTLNNENIIYVPNTLDGENIISSHLEENSLLIDGTNQMLANLDAGNHRVTYVSNAISSTDAVNKSQLDLKSDTTYVDGNFLNKTTTSTQNVAGKLTFNNTDTSILTKPVIKFQNAINTSSNGMVLHFEKTLVNQPNLQIGGLVWLDKDPSGALRRVCEMIVSNDSASNPLFDIKFSSGSFNPLTINNTQTSLRNDDYFFINKSTGQTLLKYQNSSDKWTCLKPLDMNTTNQIINLADPTSNQDGATKAYVDSHSANNNYLLRSGVLPMTGNLQMGSNNITNCNDITSTGNQIFGTNSTNNLDVKSSAFFEADVLIETNKHLAFYNSDFTTDSGMKMYFDRSVGTLGTFFMDMRGSEIRVRTDPSSAPTSERVKINNNETTINNNLICNGNVTLGNNATGDTTTINSIANFGSIINNFRVNLRSVSANHVMSNSNIEGGILCINTSTIDITLPPKDTYWNGRSYFIKSQTSNVNILMNTGTSIDNNTGTLSITINYISYHFGFDDDYETNGKVWKLATHG